MASPEILLKNQWIFIDPVLKICALVGKRLLITKVITPQIKNTNKFEFYLFEFDVKNDIPFLFPYNIVIWVL